MKTKIVFTNQDTKNEVASNNVLSAEFISKMKQYIDAKINKFYQGKGYSVILIVDEKEISLTYQVGIRKNQAGTIKGTYRKEEQLTKAIDNLIEKMFDQIKKNKDRIITTTRKAKDTPAEEVDDSIIGTIVGTVENYEEQDAKDAKKYSYAKQRAKEMATLKRKYKQLIAQGNKEEAEILKRQIEADKRFVDTQTRGADKYKQQLRIDELEQLRLADRKKRCHKFTDVEIYQIAEDADNKYRR